MADADTPQLRRELARDLQLAPIERRSPSKEVFSRLKDAIVAGEIAPGDRLPPERQLAEMLGVSRASVREGLRVLEALGVIVSRTGSGPRAGTFILDEPSMAVAELFRLNIALRHFTLEEVVGLRGALERAAVVEIAQDGDPAALEPLRKLIEQMRKADSRSAFVELDSSFHVALVRLSSNGLLGYLVNVCHELIEARMSEGFRAIKDWDGARALFIEQHEAIIEALVDRDAESAERIVAAHVTGRYIEGVEA